jgi:hypothetical protein
MVVLVVMLDVLDVDVVDDVDGRELGGVVVLLLPQPAAVASMRSRRINRVSRTTSS